MFNEKYIALLIQANETQKKLAEILNKIRNKQKQSKSISIYNELSRLVTALRDFKSYMYAELETEEKSKRLSAGMKNLLRSKHLSAEEVISPGAEAKLRINTDDIESRLFKVKKDIPLSSSHDEPHDKFIAEAEKVVNALRLHVFPELMRVRKFEAQVSSAIVDLAFDVKKSNAQITQITMKLYIAGFTAKSTNEEITAYKPKKVARLALCSNGEEQPFHIAEEKGLKFYVEPYSNKDGVTYETLQELWVIAPNTVETFFNQQAAWFEMWRTCRSIEEVFENKCDIGEDTPISPNGDVAKDAFEAENKRHADKRRHARNFSSMSGGSSSTLFSSHSALQSPDSSPRHSRGSSPVSDLMAESMEAPKP